MIIDLSSFLDEANNILHFEGELEEYSLELGGRDIKIVEPVLYEGEVFRVGREKAIDIRITFTYSEKCHRCLELATNQIKTILSGKLVKGKEDTDTDDENQGYDEVLYYENNNLDPDDYILNQVLSPYLYS